MTTLESFQALSDEALIEKVAVEVMGWLPFETITGKRQCWHRGHGIEGDDIFQEDWNPLTDWGHTMQVAQKATNAFGIQILLTLHEGTAQIVQAPLGDYRKIEVTDPSPQRAICLAALLAVQ